MVSSRFRIIVLRKFKRAVPSKMPFSASVMVSRAPGSRPKENSQAFNAAAYTWAFDPGRPIELLNVSAGDTWPPFSCAARAPQRTHHNNKRHHRRMAQFRIAPDPDGEGL